MNYKSMVKADSLLGVTTAYSITNEMIEKEGLFDNWQHCEGAISDAIDDFNDSTKYAQIHGLIDQGTEFMIEGDLPYQKSDTDCGNPQMDMAQFIAKSVHVAVREHEEFILKANDKSYLNADNQTLNMDFYLVCVIQRLLTLATKDCKVMSIIDNAKVDSENYQSSELYSMAMNATININGLGEGFKTLDYFKRLDYITNALDTNYWLEYVTNAYDKATSNLQDAILALSLSMGMGRLIQHGDSNDMSVKSTVES